MTKGKEKMLAVHDDELSARVEAFIARQRFAVTKSEVLRKWILLGLESEAAREVEEVTIGR